MSSFYDQIFSEIDAARKLATDFANRYGRNQPRVPRAPSEADRLAQEEAAAEEITALAAEENRLASQAHERAESRAKARAEVPIKATEPRAATPPLGPAGSRWNAKTILSGLAKLRVQERSAAEGLIRKAHESVVADASPGVSELRPAPVRGMWSPSLGAKQVWYFTSEGTRCGPVTFGELRTMASSWVLDPRLDLVWKEGMAGWKQAGLLDGLFERRNVPAGIPDRPVGKGLSLVAALPKDLTAALASKHLSWPGMGRWVLWLAFLLVPLLWSQLVEWSRPTLVETFGSAAIFKFSPFVSIVPVVVLIYLVLGRLENLGMSRWWALLLTIPLLNLWVGYRCLACPSGYAHHRQMDRAGMIIAIVLVVSIPAIGYAYVLHPDWLTQAQLQPAVQRIIGKVGRIISPK